MVLYLKFFLVLLAEPKVTIRRIPKCDLLGSVSAYLGRTLPLFATKFAEDLTSFSIQPMKVGSCKWPLRETHFDVKKFLRP